MTDALSPYQGYAVSPYPSGSFAPAMVTDQRTNGAVVAVAWVVALLSFFYMLPWAIAATRGKSNATAVGVVNLLVGWTFIGWVVALVMACGAHQAVFAGGQTVNVLVAQQHFPQPRVAQAMIGAPPAPAEGWYPAPDGSPGRQYWDGRAWTHHRSS